jgi:hypothetical protein
MANRNITLSLPEPLVKKVRIMAADRDTSVSALVAELLARDFSTDAERRAIWDREKEVMERGIFTIGPVSWTRDELHER